MLYAQCISVGNYNVVWCSWRTNKSAHSLTFSESKRLLAISGYLLRVGSPVRQSVINKKRYSPRHKKCNACCQRFIPTSCCETKNGYREWNQLSITEIRKQEKKCQTFHMGSALHNLKLLTHSQVQISVTAPRGQERTWRKQWKLCFQWPQLRKRKMCTWKSWKEAHNSSDRSNVVLPKWHEPSTL